MLDEDDLSTACEGIPDEQLEKFQVSDDPKPAGADHNKQAAMCPICLESLCTEKMLCKLPCHHTFHYTYHRIFTKKKKSKIDV